MIDLEQRFATQLEELRSELVAIIPPTAAVTERDALNFVSQSHWDDRLARFVVWSEATPKGLANFCAENPDLHVPLIEDLWNDPLLLQQMLMADGAARCRGGPKNRPGEGPAQYGPAMKIYTEIQMDSDHWNGNSGGGGGGVCVSDVLQRLALAIALEHAVPMVQTNPQDCDIVHNNDDDDSGTDKFVDPVRRYLNYEMAYLDGELDPSFSDLTTWELRHVVNGDETDEVASWGRRMLRNFRPDHVTNPDYTWRYINMVRSNIRYGSQDVGNDSKILHKYQNILMNGGICGRRAFFGRFILRAFGIPTTARPSKGHGALCHWTPNDGWVVNLGGGWGAGWTKTLYRNDLDFLSTTQARQVQEAYQSVKRAQWIGDVMGERRVYGSREPENKGPVGFWNDLSLTIQQDIIDKKLPKPPTKAERKAAEARDAKKNKQAKMNKKEAIVNHPDGRISIPAAVLKSKSKDVTVMASLGYGDDDNGGGQQQQQQQQQIYLPSFASQGQTVLRGGTWKCDAVTCCSGKRLLSGGYGKYHDWGFRVAMSASSDNNNNNNIGGGSCDPSNLKDEPRVKTLDLGNGVSLELVYIKPGKFVMGGESTEGGRFACVEVPKHPVSITKGYYLGKYPVTQAQYAQVMGGEKKNPSKSTRAPDCPVDNIGEMDALNFCRAFSERSGGDVRLPTEAEWEYACRAGCGDTHWFFGNANNKAVLGEYAWFKDNAGGKSHPVGQKKANPWGLHDMYGNVWERVADKYDRSYYASGTDRGTDPVGPKQGISAKLEYKVEIPQAGTYTLRATVVTANTNQRLNVSLQPFSDDNNNKSCNAKDSEVHVLKLPFTLGEWQDSEPVFLQLPKGTITLHFWRDRPPQYGIAVKEFTLQPASPGAVP